MKKTIERTKKVGRKLGTYIPDIVLSIVFIFLWVKSGSFIREYIDETAATPDAAFLVKFLFAAIGLVAKNLTVKLVMLIAWSKLDLMLETKSENILNANFSEREQYIMALLVYCYNGLMFVIMLNAI